MPEPKSIRVRGIHLVYEGRGYHNQELDLPEGVARHFINLGRAVEVQVQSPPASVQTPAKETPGGKFV